MDTNTSDILSLAARVEKLESENRLFRLGALVLWLQNDCGTEQTSGTYQECH
jgi:hypothetical protein